VAKQGKKSSGSGFFWGLMLGFLTGLVLALLYAPQTGEETREQLSEQSIELRRRGFESYQQFAAGLRERYGDAWQQGREAYARTKDEVLSHYNKAKSAQ
jgi:gas vesicle protein